MQQDYNNSGNEEEDEEVEDEEEDAFRPVLRHGFIV